MVQVIGWTPSSHNTNPGTSSLTQFISPFHNDNNDKIDHNYPSARSGHRCFTDNDYFYVIGGYTHQTRRGSIFKELWAMSLATFEWRRYETTGEFPDTLASFAIVQTSPYSKSFILFGGSGTNFGASSSNDFYYVIVNNDDCTLESQKLNVGGTIPSAVYGHAMCVGEVEGKYYIIGGTEGVRFNFDVHSLTKKVNPNATSKADMFIWNCELVTQNRNFDGRYRLEATYDENKHCLLFFGGGNNNEVFGFEKMVVLDLRNRETTEIDSAPDTEHGFPEGRRCHTLVRHNRKAVMTGGVNQSDLVYNDVWIFDLDTYSWKKYHKLLPEAVLFHDSVITKDGWMLSFGGVQGISAVAKRNKILHGVWFGVPSLQCFALETLRKKYPRMFSGLYCGNLQPSQVIDVYHVLCTPGKIDREEKEIIKNGEIRFQQNNDRKRYYLNANSEDFLVRHHPDDEPDEPIIRNQRRRIRLDQNPEQDEQNQGLQAIHNRIERILDRLFNRNIADDDEEVIDEEAAEASDDPESEDDVAEPDIDDDDFENGRFELIPQRRNRDRPE